jgi:hypothetical protein
MSLFSGSFFWLRLRPFPAGAEMRDQIGIRGIHGPLTFANAIHAVKAALGIDRVVDQPE